MSKEEFARSTIGEDYLRTGQEYPTDALLDYLSGLIKMRMENGQNIQWVDKYTTEIEAVKAILTKQTA